MQRRFTALYRRGSESPAGRRSKRCRPNEQFRVRVSLVRGDEISDDMSGKTWIESAEGRASGKFGFTMAEMHFGGEHRRASTAQTRWRSSIVMIRPLKTKCVTVKKVRNYSAYFSINCF
jgi:hypothetical protein